MSLLRPVYWQQGIFLQPQHFQYAQASEQALQARMWRSLRPQLHGVGALNLSAEALQRGVVSSGLFEAVMPDGQWVSNRLNARLPERDLRAAELADGSHLLAVGLPKLSSERPNVAHGAGDGRFEPSSYAESLPDLYDDAPEAEIGRLWLRLRFLVGDEIAAATQLDTLPIARLVVEGGDIRLDEHYAPPALSVRAVERLHERVQHLLELVASAQARLADLARPWREDDDDALARRMRDALVRAELAQCQTQGQHLLRIDAEPAALYEVLLVLLARLPAIGGLSAPEPPAWSHDDPLRAFEAAGALLVALLEQLRSGPDSVVPFKSAAGWLQARIPGTVQVGRHAAYLLVEGIARNLLERAPAPKLASRTHIETVVSRALPGVALQPQPQPPYGAPTGEQTLCWSVAADDATWQECLHDGIACLHWPGLPAGARASLLFFRA